MFQWRLAAAQIKEGRDQQRGWLPGGTLWSSMWALLSVPRLESRSREKEGFFVLRAVVSRTQKTNGLFSEREREWERACLQTFWCPGQSDCCKINPNSPQLNPLLVWTRCGAFCLPRPRNATYGKHITPPSIPICLKWAFPNPHFGFFYNPPLYYNLLNIHLLPFRQRILKFKHQAIFIMEDYAKQ